MAARGRLLANSLFHFDLSLLSLNEDLQIARFLIPDENTGTRMIPKKVKQKNRQTWVPNNQETALLSLDSLVLDLFYVEKKIIP